MAIYSEFSHEKWWFSIAMLVYQRVIFLPSGQQDDVPRQAPLGLHYCDKEAVGSVLWWRVSRSPMALVCISMLHTSYPNPSDPCNSTLITWISSLSKNSTCVYKSHTRAHDSTHDALICLYISWIFLAYVWYSTLPSCFSPHLQETPIFDVIFL